MSNRSKFNSKRKIAENIQASALQTLETTVKYTGSPYHKRNPGDFGFIPPSQPRDDKSLCDGIRVSRRSDALKLLQVGIRQGLISAWDGTGYPKYIWSMTKTGDPLEAQHSGNGEYHGYPLETNDDFREHVIQKWNGNDD